MTHLYTGVPEPVSWPLYKVEQKGMAFYISSARICEIDAVCSVPSLPEHIESDEAGRRVLDDSIGDDEWQRRLAPRRINSIREFIEGSENIIANTPILFVRPGTGSVTIEENTLTVDLSKFLKKTSIKGEDKWYDVVPGQEDYRPIWLIDGQHRVRGMSSRAQERTSTFQLSFSRRSSDFTKKIFAEINTLQTKLTSMHTLFMQHRFHIPSHISKRDFRPWEEGVQEHHNSRANHLSYEAAWVTLPRIREGPSSTESGFWTRTLRTSLL